MSVFRYRENFWFQPDSGMPHSPFTALFAEQVYVLLYVTLKKHITFIRFFKITFRKDFLDCVCIEIVGERKDCFPGSKDHVRRPPCPPNVKPRGCIHELSISGMSGRPKVMSCRFAARAVGDLDLTFELGVRQGEPSRGGNGLK